MTMMLTAAVLLVGTLCWIGYDVLWTRKRHAARVQVVQLVPSPALEELAEVESKMLARAEEIASITIKPGQQQPPPPPAGQKNRSDPGSDTRIMLSMLEKAAEIEKLSTKKIAARKRF